MQQALFVEIFAGDSGCPQCRSPPTLSRMVSGKSLGRSARTQARLLFSESEHGADMFHATGFRVPDPFVFLESRGKTSILLSDLEIDRGRKEARVDEVVSWSDLG